MDEEIAIGQIMVQMADWASGEGTATYPLAEACQDHLISLAIEESLKTGQTVTTPRASWAK